MIKNKFSHFDAFTKLPCSASIYLFIYLQFSLAFLHTWKLPFSVKITYFLQIIRFPLQCLFNYLKAHFLLASKFHFLSTSKSHFLYIQYPVFCFLQNPIFINLKIPFSVNSKIPFSIIKISFLSTSKSRFLSTSKFPLLLISKTPFLSTSFPFSSFKKTHFTPTVFTLISTGISERRKPAAQHVGKWCSHFYANGDRTQNPKVTLH